MVNFEAIIIGQKYSRPTLAKLWGYRSFNAISRGIFSPQGMNFLIFIINNSKLYTSILNSMKWSKNSYKTGKMYCKIFS